MMAWVSFSVIQMESMVVTRVRSWGQRLAKMGRLLENLNQTINQILARMDHYIPTGPSTPQVDDVILGQRIEVKLR